MAHPESSIRKGDIAALFLTVAVLVWSGINPHDRFTWVLEVFPALIGIPTLIVLYPRFRFTPLVTWLIAIHMMILMVGGKYTYALTPVGEWMKGWFGFERNNYDRIGHLAQGFIPAMMAREVFIRRSPLKGGKWLFFMVVCFCLAVSATYELIEAGVAIASGDEAVAFLGTQGDQWDTQSDMALALVGSIAAQVLLSGWQRRQMERAE
ncbi:DUF2238 domain-containing protein [soil metagenome]